MTRLCVLTDIQFKQHQNITIINPLVHDIANIIHGVTFFLVTTRTVTPRMDK